MKHIFQNRTICLKNRDASECVLVVAELHIILEEIISQLLRALKIHVYSTHINVQQFQSTKSHGNGEIMI